jgi:hypothetical protein
MMMSKDVSAISNAFEFASYARYNASRRRITN